MSFLGIEIGSSGVRASRIALERTGHNISNANVEGYSRQVVDVSSNVISGVTNYDAKVNTAGSGVRINNIIRYRDEYLDLFYRSEKTKLGSQDAKENYLNQVELIFNTDLTSETSGIRAKISSFLNSFQDLTNNSVDVSRRQQIIQEGTGITDFFNEASKGLKDAGNRIGLELTNTIKDINEIAEKLSNLNVKIVNLSAKGGGGYADLQDERGRLMDKLSNLVDFKAYENSETKSMTVYIGSNPLVSDNHSFPLSVDKDGNIRHSIGTGDNNLLYGIDSTGRKVDRINNGKLDAILEMRDEILPEYTDKLDSQARTFIEKVNLIHKNGYDASGNTGMTFFKDKRDMTAVPPETNNAGNIELSDEILNAPNRISAAVGRLSSSIQMSAPDFTINSAIPLSQNPAGAFMTAPAASGTIGISYYDETGTLNSRTVNWNNGESLENIINNINSKHGGITASFDVTNQKLTLTRDTTVGDGTNITVGAPAPYTPPGSVYIQDLAGNFVTGFSSMAAGSISTASSGDGQNALNISTIGNDKIMGNQLNKSEIKDWQSLLTKLQANSGNPAVPEGRIFSFLDGASQAIVTGWVSGTQLSDGNATILMNGLNNVIKSDDFYSGVVFAGTLSGEGEILRSNYPDLSATQMDRFNRILFENTFQSEISLSTPMNSTEHMTSFLSDIGTKKQTATELKYLYTSTTEQALALREEVSGVSLDEEFANMIKFQKSFEASARFLNVSSEILDTIINKLGV
jgi:flagellar hook-associated protein 1 FlgK